jgi:phage terminase small subunit
MAGRRPTPTAIKRQKGNPGRRPLPTDEPKPLVGKPTCPRWLPKGAKQIFRQLVRHLEPLRVLTRCEPMLAPMALTLWRWQQAELAIEAAIEAATPEDGAPVLTETIKTKGGGTYRQQLPEIAIARSYLKDARALAIEYGLTAASRVKVHMIGADVQNAIDMILDGHTDMTTALGPELSAEELEQIECADAEN